jgi:uncharacterized protein (TIGR02001 family)
MKNFSLVVLSILSLGILSSNVIAEETSAVSANISLANDYIWRGLPQHLDVTDNDKAKSEPTLSGGFDYDIGSGFALGVWGSNVSFNGGTNTYNSASFELDLYGSYSGEYKGFGYEVGYISYAFPNAKDADVEEIYLSLSMMGISLTGYKGQGEANNNLEISYNRDVEGIDVTLTAGDYDKSNKYYSLALSKSLDGIDYTLSMVKTDYDDIDTKDENFVVFSIGKSF